MAKPPAEVSFPGDKNRRKKVRMRGIKKASKEIQHRLDKNLEELMDDPEIFVPEIRGEVDNSFFTKDRMAKTLKELSVVASKRNDPRWLRKRMGKKGGDPVCCALAGSLVAASEEDRSTVAVFNNPVFGVASYIRRGSGKQSHLAGIQNHTHPKMRLLVWDEHAKSGQWFFSWDGGFVFTGRTPSPPAEWVDWSLDNSSIELTGDEVRWSKGLDEGTVAGGELTKAGWLRMEFIDGTTVGVSQTALAKTEEQFTQSVAWGMLPPRLSEVASVEWMWRPEGWPEDRDLPEEGVELLEEVLGAWLGLTLEDSVLARSCRSSILNSINDGYVVGSHWFAEDARVDFLEHMTGTTEERDALACILDSLESGVHVRTDGVVLEIEADVVRFEDSACHPNLVSLWPEHGLTVLEEMYGLVDEEAESILSKQERRKQGFGAFLRELGDSRSTARRLERLPWNAATLPGPLAFADGLVRQSVESGVASTVSKARKGKGLDMAMGWAWLNVHDRTESDAWRFDEASRDKGGDWVPALQAVWDAAEDLLLNDNEDSVQDYKAAMKWLAEVSGSGELP
ncbi:MAG: hypothetical protein QF709_02215 [Candidatus Thalassarchaeum sp.]|nr:hypothetical protein [Candidatus Thalassarchaeum sp.]